TAHCCSFPFSSSMVVDVTSMSTAPCTTAQPRVAHASCAVVLPGEMTKNRLVTRLLLLNSDPTGQIGITYTQRRGRIRMSDTPSHESGKNRGGVSRRSMLAGGVAAGAIGIGAATASGAMAAPRPQGPVV